MRAVLTERKKMKKIEIKELEVYTLQIEAKLISIQMKAHLAWLILNKAYMDYRLAINEARKRIKRMSKVLEKKKRNNSKS